MWSTRTLKTRTAVGRYWLRPPSSLFRLGNQASALRFFDRALSTNEFANCLRHLGSTTEFTRSGSSSASMVQPDILRGKTSS